MFRHYYTYLLNVIVLADAGGSCLLCSSCFEKGVVVLKTSANHPLPFNWGLVSRTLGL